MSSPKDIAISFEEVTKIYKMYQSRWQMARDALGFKAKQNIPEFHALKGVNFTIHKEERVGIIGRNGAGKSTLLKLITGNFQPSSGHIKTAGNIQALMNTGVGFHPEFTGLENIKASLLYNGLDTKALKAAIEDVIDFVELGDFLEQPFKTYSLGMQSRLQFAVATAIQPEILIVDEVLGAGDAYFVAKSADRMKRLTESGCTLLLVSHSNGQILQFCERAIWIECGEVIKDGPALEVVKLYEQFTKKMERTAKGEMKKIAGSTPGIVQSKWLMQKILKEIVQESVEVTEEDTANNTDMNVSQGGISRWEANEEGLKIESFQILDANQKPCYLLEAGHPFTFKIHFKATKTGRYECYFAILILDAGGNAVTRHRSERYQLELSEGETRTMSLAYDKLLLGNGDYVVSPSIFKDFGENGSEARFYDLLSRSYTFSVNNFNNDPSKIIHPANWSLTHTLENTEEQLNQVLI